MKNQHVALASDGCIAAWGKTWHFDAAFVPRLILQEGELPFSAAGEITRQTQTTGLGEGCIVRYAGFPGYPSLAFETCVTVDATTGFVDCTFVPLATDEVPLRAVAWPPPLVADDPGSYAVLNTMQGQLLPTDWPEAICERLPFDGQMGSEAAYMPWWGEITPQGGYLAWVRQVWDSAYTIAHPAGGPTRVYARHLPSLGKMTYPRTVTYCFTPAGTNYVDLCKLYRRLAEEEGKAVTLAEKALRNARVDALIGCSVLHAAGKTHVTPDSAYYNAEEPEKNDRLTPFAHWAARVQALHAQGLGKLYLHLDGWGQPGYDNQHPDYLPPCEEAGGWAGMRALRAALAAQGDLFGIHDQYRDYYLDAPTHDPDHAVHLADGTCFEMARWAGGRQHYLSASLAPGYVRRNFQALLDGGVTMDAAYLDVFTCNELDENSNPRHRMTRQACAAFRNECFHYLTAHGIAPSSEEVNDWAMPVQVFCHWAPYYGSTAVPVPLYNLVYHDCVLIPWKLERDSWGIPKGTDGFLHALLQGGMGYIDDTLEGAELAENIARLDTLSALQQRVAKLKMTDHTFLSEDRTRQQSTFADGTRVVVDFSDGSYAIHDA